MTETPHELIIPQETVNDESVRILSWKAPSGTTVAKDEVVCEIETSKTVIEMCAPIAGVLNYSYAVGEEVAIGAPLCTIVPASIALINAAFTETKPSIESGVVQDSKFLPGSAQTRLTPLARRTAREHGIADTAFENGRLIRRDDVLRMAGLLTDPTRAPRTPREKRNGRSSSQEIPRLPSVAGVSVAWTDLPRHKVIEGRILSKGRANALQSSVTTRIEAPHLRRRAQALNQSEVALDALVIFEVSRLLRNYPQLNAVYADGKIGFYSDINISWAIDSGSNLVAPVLKQCDLLTLDEIVANMEGQLESYLDNALSLAALNSGTFSISNLSSDGACFFNPLISEGQSAILGVSSNVTLDGIEEMYLTLSFDHQVAEGRTAARFLKELRDRFVAHSQVEEIKSFSNESSRSSMPIEASGNHCMICQRDYANELHLKAVLLRSEVPPGLVCSLCISGF